MATCRMYHEGAVTRQLAHHNNKRVGDKAERKRMRETVGHEHAWDRLLSVFERGQVHHAYVLAGPESIGKTTLALDFARLLVCESSLPAAEKPCGVCAACRRVTHGNHPDVLLVEAEEGKRLLGVDAVRETVVRMANLAPSAGGWRVFVIPEVERMTANTVNALLKTLEEPPPGVVIVLTSAEPETLLPTLLSRCQVLALQPLPTEDIARALRERWHASAEEAAALAELAQGKLGWAVRALERPELRNARVQVLERLAGLARTPRDERLRQAAGLAPDAETARTTLRLWLHWWRDVTLAACGSPHLASAGSARAEAERQGRALGQQRAEAFLRKLLDAQAALDANANPRLTYDVLLLDLPYIATRA
jgi:DNA polymerase-3 subunit delta'